MKKKLLSLFAAVSLTTGLGLAMAAAPASAEAGALVSGCTLDQAGPGTSSCPFIGAGPIGTYQLAVENGHATLTITCTSGWTTVTFKASAGGTLLPGESEGNYSRPGLLTNNCYATLSVTGTSLTVATANVG